MELNINPSDACYSVGALFPTFGRDLGLFFDSGLESLSRYKTLESTERFKMYFEFSLNPISFSDFPLESIINSFDEQELINALNRIYKEEKYLYFLRAISDEIDTIPMDRLPVVLSALIAISARIDDKPDQIDYDDFSDFEESIIVIDKMIHRFANEDLTLFLKGIIEKMDKYSVKVLALIIIWEFY